MRCSVAAAVLAVSSLLAAPLAAQKKERAYDPPRPRLPAGADSNSGGEYFRAGMAVLAKNPGDAAAAFHWAARLDPMFADAYYAERVAVHLTDIRRLAGYIYGDRSVLRRKDVLQVDSLELEALLRNPVLYPRLDRIMLESFVDAVNGQTTRVDWDQTDPGIAAWLALSEPNFPKAVALYAKAIKKDRKAYGYHLERAIAFYHSGQADSAIGSVEKYLEGRRAEEKDELVRVYQSKAMAEYTIGYIHEQAGRYDKAKEAYGRALTEDLSFGMAHAALADIARVQGDSATALSEFDLAIGVRPDDPTLRLRYGAALLQAGRPADAATQLERAVAIEPLYAMPWLLLGQAAEKAGKRDRAVEAYRSFVRLAARGMTKELGMARDRLTALGAAGAGTE